MEFMKIRLFVLAVVSAGLCATLCGCGTTRVTSRRSIGAAPVQKPATIYVADFELDAAKVKSEPGLISALELPEPGPRLLPPLPGSPKDPQKLARDLQTRMSVALVKNLTRAGLQARRLNKGDSMPTSGWLVRGVFAEVNQGNQLRRALIGFGAGETDLQIVVDFNDLSEGAPSPFQELNASARSGKAPGAGPMIVLGPAGAVARFVIAGKDLERSVKQTASKIADEIVSRTRQTL